GGADDDTVTMGSLVSDGSIDLGGGADKLTLGNFTNTVTVANVESLLGGTDADVITLAAALEATNNLDLGAGLDTLNLGDFANSGSISGVETLIGGSSS